MKYKALFIVNSLGFGGAEKHVVSLLNNLDTDAAELSLVYLKNDTALLPQIHAERLKEIFPCQVEKRIDLKAAATMARYIDAHEIDLLVCTNLFPLVYGWLARLLSKRKPRVIEVYHTTTLATRKEKRDMLLFRPLFWMADLLVYVCQNQRTHWSARGLGARNVSVIHNGIDIEYFRDQYAATEKSALRARYGFSDDDYVVGLCAAMRPEKAHGDLLAAIAGLNTRGLKVKGLLIGDGAERAVIEQQIAGLGLAGQVCITGFAQDVRPLIAICDAMVITSHSVETFSIAALEAMALEKPMIMTNIGGAAEQVTSGVNGYIYEAGDIDALADALLQLSSPAQQVEMGARARAIVEQKFSLPVMVEAYQQLFARMAARNSPSSGPGAS